MDNSMSKKEKEHMNVSLLIMFQISREIWTPWLIVQQVNLRKEMNLREEMMLIEKENQHMNVSLFIV